MKRSIALLLTLVLMLGMAACGGTAKEPEPTPSREPSASPTPEPSPEPVLNLGDEIKTSLFVIKPSFTGYAVELANWPDENYMTPMGKSAGTTPYRGDEKVVMYGEIEIEYIGNEKTEVPLKIDISADYDNGYLYKASMGHCTSIDGDWTYDGIMKFEPLSSSTSRIMRYCIIVPEQVENNTEKPLLVTFTVNGDPYTYDFRSAKDILGSDFDPRAAFYEPVDEETGKKIKEYLKSHGLRVSGYYDKTIGVYTFKFGDTTVTAELPMSSQQWAYEFNGTYEVYAGTILFSWDYGEDMHLDYTLENDQLIWDSVLEHGR